MADKSERFAEATRVAERHGPNPSATDEMPDDETRQVNRDGRAARAGDRAPAANGGNGAAATTTTTRTTARKTTARKTAARRR